MALRTQLLRLSICIIVILLPATQCWPSCSGGQTFTKAVYKNKNFPSSGAQVKPFFPADMCELGCTILTDFDCRSFRMDNLQCHLSDLSDPAHLVDSSGGEVTVASCVTQRSLDETCGNSTDVCRTNNTECADVNGIKKCVCKSSYTENSGECKLITTPRQLKEACPLSRDVCVTTDSECRDDGDGKTCLCKYPYVEFNNTCLIESCNNVNSKRVGRTGFIEECSFSALWVIICNPTWGKTEAMVACREKGRCLTSSCDAASSQFVSAQSLAIDSANFECTGSEARLFQCPPVPPSGAGCSSSQVFQVTCPKVPVGETCDITHDCADANARCKAQGSDRLCTCREQYFSSNGTCITKKPLGSSCNITVECQNENAACADAGSGKMCTCADGFYADNGTCRTKKPLGSPCNVNMECHGANTTCADAGSGEVCTCADGFYADNGLCKAKKPLGSPCNTSVECRDGNTTCADGSSGKMCICDDSYYTENAACAPKKPLGSPCNVSVECLDGNATCADDSSGKMCTCADSFYAENGACEPKKPLGSPCNVSVECQDGNATCPDGSSGKMCTCADSFYAANGMCKAKKPLGSECNMTVECQDENATCADGTSGRICTCNDGYFTDNKICRAKKQLGSQCNMSVECMAEDSECRDEAEGKTCRCVTTFYVENKSCLPKKSLGVPCNISTECREQNSYCAQVCTCKNGYHQNSGACATITNHCGEGVVYPQRRCDNIYLEAYCKCPVGFTGPRCQQRGQVFELSAKVVNMNFTEELRDENTMAFSQFEAKSVCTLLEAFKKSALKTAIETMTVVTTSIKQGSLLGNFSITIIAQNNKSVTIETVKNATANLSNIYALDFDDTYTTVSDVDECSSLILNDCSQYAVCSNHVGSFACECLSGFIDGNDTRGRGRSCLFRSALITPLIYVVPAIAGIIGLVVVTCIIMKCRDQHSAKSEKTQTIEEPDWIAVMNQLPVAIMNESDQRRSRHDVKRNHRHEYVKKHENHYKFHDKNIHQDHFKHMNKHTQSHTRGSENTENNRDSISQQKNRYSQNRYMNVKQDGRVN